MILMDPSIRGVENSMYHFLFIDLVSSIHLEPSRNHEISSGHLRHACQTTTAELSYLDLQV